MNVVLLLSINVLYIMAHCVAVNVCGGVITCHTVLLYTLIYSSTGISCYSEYMYNYV